MSPTLVQGWLQASTAYHDQLMGEGGFVSWSLEDVTGEEPGMEEDRARALLREERQRLERLLASVDADHDRVAPADLVAEDLADGADRRTEVRPMRRSPASFTTGCWRSSGPRTASRRAPTAARS